MLYGGVKVYKKEEIVNKIYLSCFGLIDYPVSYYGKIYRTKSISDAFGFDKVVKFMGDDLNFTISFLPTIQTLVIVPEVVYNYYYGGITSKFMPYAFDDFLALYKLKTEYAKCYLDNEETYHFMNNEMMWITLSRFTDCYVLGGYTREQVIEEIKRVCDIDIVRNSAKYIAAEEHALNGFSKSILSYGYDDIWEFIKKDSRKKKIRICVKKALSLISPN